MALKFSEIQALFAEGNQPTTLNCIATPYGNRCDAKLNDNQLLNLHDMLLEASEPMLMKEVRDIINCLICADHQYGKYNHKDKVEATWQDEFQHLNFSTRRSPSPYSLSSRPSTPRRSSPRSNGSTPGRLASTPASSPRSFSSTSLSPPPPPNFQASHTRSTGAPVLSAAERLDVGFDTSSAAFANDYTSAVSPGLPESPLASRGRRHSASPPSDMGGFNDDHSDRAVLQRSLSAVDEDPRNEESPYITEQEQLSTQEPVLQPEQPDYLSEVEFTPRDGPSTTWGRFEHGEASAWAPWTIRKASLELIREPLLNPKATGYVYVAQVEHTNRTIVKIGRTYQKPNARLNQIAKEHRQQFNMGSLWYRAGIPALQLERLERLVHSDLAYYQRNWLVCTDRSHKTHHEYFEVDMSTAQQTIDVWLAIIRKVGIRAGAMPNESVFESVHSDPDLSIGAANGPDNVDAWKRLNEDHSRRINLWRTHLILCKYTATQRLPYKLAWWSFMSLLLWLLLDMSPYAWYVGLLFAIPSLI